MTSTSGGNKRIFISDIHMGDPRSMTGQFPYGWLRENIRYLSDFLHDQLNAQDVIQVVILGDLFDQWVIPTGLDPLTRLDSICSNPKNKGIIDNLKALAARSKLSYVPGNHDMSTCPKDIIAVKKFINATFPGINFICEDDQPTGVYRADNLVAEHGNMYSLFNAPDTWTNLDSSFLPLGYFISRMVAYKVAQTGNQENSLDILIEFIPKYIHNQNFIYDLFLAVADDARLKKSDKFNMGNMSGFPASITIDEVANKYKQLIDDWNKKHDKIDSRIAIEADSFMGLLEAACVAYLQGETDTKIVIFGHTHTWKNEEAYETMDENDQELEESDLSFSPQPCKGIYANSGTWIDSTHLRTYVETELDEDYRRHYVRVKSYPDDELQNELFVTL